MSQLDTSDTSQTDPDARRLNYLQWRRRLADQQEDLRNYGEPDAEPTVSSEWSPEALFATGSGSTASADVAPVDVAPAATEGTEPTPEGPAHADLGRDVAAAPTSDPAWDRTEVEALLRQFRSTAGSPRTTSRAVREAAGPDLVQEHDDHVVRYFDGSRVVRTSTAETKREAASVGDQLRELNRLRVEGELKDDEFNRHKRALFSRGSTVRPLST